MLLLDFIKATQQECVSALLQTKKSNWTESGLQLLYFWDQLLEGKMLAVYHRLLHGIIVILPYFQHFFRRQQDDTFAYVGRIVHIFDGSEQLPVMVDGAP